jgi:hypothetical protein
MILGKDYSCSLNKIVENLYVDARIAAGQGHNLRIVQCTYLNWIYNTCYMKFFLNRLVS